MIGQGHSGPDLQHVNGFNRLYGPSQRFMFHFRSRYARWIMRGTLAFDIRHVYRDGDENL